MQRSVLLAVVLASACAPDERSRVSEPTPAWDASPVVEGTPPDPVPPDPPEAPTAWPAVLLNEVLPGNDSISMDEALDFDDWVELYNGSDAEVDLTGWGLADDDEDPDWTFPDGQRIGPGEHLVVWLDDEPEEGGLHATIGLDADADEVALFTPDGALTDLLVFVDQPDDVVLGRFPSGGVFVASSIVASPGNLNPLDPGLSLDPSDALYPDDDLVRFDLSITAEGAAALQADTTAEVPATLAFEGASMDVTLTIKGGWGSLRGLDDKAAFRVDLDGLLAGQRLRGMENLTLNNMVQDASTVHETLAYTLFREASVPAPRVAHAEVWLNGEYRGLYLNVESPDDQFLQRWFENPDGNLYEGAYGPDLTRDGIWSLELDEQGAAEPTDRSELMPIVELLEGPANEETMLAFEALVDVDTTLRMLAGEVVLAHWDGYFYYPNNYRIYHDPVLDRITLLPWGVDQTFGSAAGIHSPSGDLADWCLSVPSCRTRYDLALLEMSSRLAALDCEGRIDAILARIGPAFAADTYRESSWDDLLYQVDATVAFCASEPAAIAAELFP